MTRKKVNLAFITNDSARKATFKKRKKGLMKKVEELSTLCGIDACAVIYSPYEPEPEYWPDMHECQRVVARFKKMPGMEQTKKMVNQEGFICHRVAKVEDQLRKMRKENRENEITQLMHQCLNGKSLHGLGVPELNDMGLLLDKRLKEIYQRIEGLKKEKMDDCDTVVGRIGETPSQNQSQCSVRADVAAAAAGGEAVNSENHAEMLTNVFFP